MRIAPWSYDAMYALMTHVPRLPQGGERVLSALARRRLRRLVDEHAPDVVVTTHPALTAVLGRMRLHRRLQVPLCATVTDLADYELWCHRGVDVHLVMHEATLSEVERVAGPGSATLVRPLVAEAFLRERDPASARRALGLHADRSLVAVSGGGWGVGDFEGAVASSLAAGAGQVVVLAGDRERDRQALARRFAADERVSVWGFTRRMPELVQAADVLIHSTGGVTSLEAVSAGCPLVAFGASAGHIRVHNAAMARLGLLRLPAGRVELESIIAEQLRRPQAPARLGATGVAPGDVVAAAVPRIRPLAVWRLAAGRIATALLCGAVAVVGMTSDEAYSVVARPLDLRPAKRLATPQHDVALVLQAEPAAVPALADALAAAGAHASFAERVPAATALQRSIAAAGDDVLPELGGTPPPRWLHTRRLLAGGPRRGDDRVFLADPAGLSLGQDLVARTMGAVALSARVSINVPGDQALPPVSPGDVVVVTVPATDAASVSDVAAVVHRLGARGLRAASVSALAASAAGPAGELSRPAAPASTTARAASVAAVDAGSWPSRSAARTGASATGTATCTQKTSGATRVAGARCSAVISLSRPTPDARPVRIVQAATVRHAS
jgi:hypothetical protein